MEQEQKGEESNGMYTYKHHCHKGLDMHEIFVKKSRSRVLLSYIGVVLLLAKVSQSLLAKERLCLGSAWSITFGILVAKYLQYKPVKKGESLHKYVVGSDNASFCGSARNIFLKILKPLLNKCVTPVTCYWSLALLLRDEEEIMLVFQKFRRPVKMLAPIWKALSAFTSVIVIFHKAAIVDLRAYDKLGTNYWNHLVVMEEDLDAEGKSSNHSSSTFDDSVPSGQEKRLRIEATVPSYDTCATSLFATMISAGAAR